MVRVAMIDDVAGAFFFMASYWFALSSPAKTKRGVTTHAPSQALACPQKNAFGTPEGACF
jgi:hypothetical protein